MVIRKHSQQHFCSASPAFRYNLFVWVFCYPQRSGESTSGLHTLTDPSLAFRMTAVNKKYFHFNRVYNERAMLGLAT